MMKLEEVTIGRKVWVMGHWSSSPEVGTVKAIKYTDPTPQCPSVPYAEIDWDNLGTSSAMLNKMYPSLEALQIDEKERENKAVADIKAKIHDVKDLVKFMYHATLNGGEYVNYDERRAVRELAKELLDLDLE